MEHTEAEGWKKTQRWWQKHKWWGRVQPTVWHCRSTNKMCDVSIISVSPSTSNVFFYLRPSCLHTKLVLWVPRIFLFKHFLFISGVFTEVVVTAFAHCILALRFKVLRLWTQEKAMLSAQDHCKVQGANSHISASPPNMFIKLINVFLCLSAHFSSV